MGGKMARKEKLDEQASAMRKKAQLWSREALKKLRWLDFFGDELRAGDSVLTPSGRFAAVLYGADDVVVVRYFDDEDVAQIAPRLLRRAQNGEDGGLRLRCVYGTLKERR